MIKTANFKKNADGRSSLFLLGAFLLWLATFPAKGALFQIALYLLPIAVYCHQKTRTEMQRGAKELIILTLCFVFPLLISDLRAFWVADINLDKEPFNQFWRLALFPIALSALYRSKLVSAQKTLLIFLAVAFAYCLWVIVPFLLNLVSEHKTISWRMSGLVNNPNPFGFLMVAGTLISFHQLLYASSWQRGAILSSILVFLLAASLISGSRSAWLGGGLSVIVLIVFERDKIFHQKNKILFAIALISLFLLFMLGYGSYYSDTIYNRLKSISNGDIRIEIWTYYLNLSMQHPIIGWPLTDELRFVSNGFSHGPHNVYLSVLVESGALGLIALLSGLILVARKIFSTPRELKSILFPLYLLLCAFCFFNSPFTSSVMTQGVFALLMGLALGVNSHNQATSH